MHPYAIIGQKRWKTIVIICIFSYFVWLFVNGKLLPEWISANNFLPPISFGIIIGLFYWLYDRVIWKYNLIYKHIPNLGGQWRCLGESFKRRDEENSETETICWQAHIIIQQTWEKISIDLQTGQSVSASIAASLKVDKGRLGYELSYVYQNIPNQGTPGDMRTHEGFCRLRFNPPLSRAQGYYFTNARDRLSYGEMTLERIQNAND